MAIFTVQILGITFSNTWSHDPKSLDEVRQRSSCITFLRQILFHVAVALVDMERKPENFALLLGILLLLSLW